MTRALTLLAAGLMLAGPSLASGTATPEGQAELEALRAQLLEKMRAIDAQQRELLEKMEEVERQRRELELLVNRVNDLDSYRAGADTSERQPIEVGTERKAERTAEADKVPELPRISSEVGGVLTPKGRLVVEPSFQYLYSSVNRISIEGFFIPPFAVIGSVDVLEVDRDTVIGALALRYGLTNRLEIELKAPYVYRKDSTRTRRLVNDTVVDRLFDAESDDIGDIEFDVRYQLPRPSSAWPYMVANLRSKAPTGTDPFKLANPRGDPPSELATGSGFWTFNPSMTFIYPSDPVVFFGNLGYLYTMEDDKGGFLFGDVDPGDAVRMNFGMGLGLNERSSISLSYSLDIFGHTRVEFRDDPTEFLQRRKIEGSDVTVGKLLLGYSLRMPNGAPFSLSVGIGATEDAPDSDLTFRFPVNFFN